MIFCKQCGSQMDENSTVCPNCGTPVTTGVVENAGAEIATPEQPKKSIFKKWWFWLVSVVAIVAVLGTIGFFVLKGEQDDFKDYYEKDLQIYVAEMAEIEGHINEVIQIYSRTEAQKYWEENKVEEQTQTLLKDISSYKTDNEDINKLHDIIVDANESLNDVVNMITKALYGEESLSRDEFNEAVDLYHAKMDEYKAESEKLAEEYGLELVYDEKADNE